MDLPWRQRHHNHLLTGVESVLACAYLDLSLCCRVITEDYRVPDRMVGFSKYERWLFDLLL